MAFTSFANHQTFFASLVQFLWELLGIDYSLVSEIIPQDPTKARTIAVCHRGEILENFEYDLSGTPCENVIEQKLCVYPANIQALFPQDVLLSVIGVDSYVGTPLVDGAGETLGLIAVLGCQPLSCPEFVTEIIQIFANRACGELSRQRSEAILRQSEEQFRQLTENILEVFYIRDLQQNRILYISPAFELIKQLPIIL